MDNVENPIVENSMKEVMHDWIEMLEKKGEWLVQWLADLPQEEWDWVSVRNASKIADLSYATIYAKINSHALECRHINSKIFVRLSQLEKINDR